MESSRKRLLLQQSDIQADRAHEQVDAAETLASHCGRQSFGEGDCVVDPIFYGEDEAGLLVVGCGDAHCGEELPDVDVFASIDVAGEDRGEGEFESVEEGFKGAVPGYVSYVSYEL